MRSRFNAKRRQHLCTARIAIDPRLLSAVAASDFDTIDIVDLTGVDDVSEPKDSGTEVIQSAYKH